MPTNLTPDRVADLIMKGGITSGVVYPPAIDEIQQRFYLSGIGGASAGAIAAALAAAAERSRRMGSPVGYDLLRALPDEIAAPGNLRSLFEPDRQTKDAFKLFLKAIELGDMSGFAKVLFGFQGIWSMIVGSPIESIVKNGHGLCTGMANDNRDPRKGLPPLVEWLSSKLDQFASKHPVNGVKEPLTFGDLASAPPAKQFPDAAGVNLRLISTCLTFGRPYALPFLSKRFLFAPQELRRFFPAYVVDYMERKGREVLALDKYSLKPLPAGLLPLPVENDMPVILAVRMSLSFPLLFCPVPLHHPDFREVRTPGQTMKTLPVFFSDGGICSNLPVHFFDSPIPRWPTLAINLQYTKGPGKYGRRGVDDLHTWMTESAADGTLEVFNDFFAKDSNLGQLLGMAGAIFRSSQVWTDNSYLKLPGFRDRIGEVWLDPHQGGMNLNMPPETIRELLSYGQRIGQRLVQRFADAPPASELSWDAHRWTRYRSITPALAQYLANWTRGVNLPIMNETPVQDYLINQTPPPLYRFVTPSDQAAALEFHRHLLPMGQAALAAAENGAFERAPKSNLVLQGRNSLTPSRPILGMNGKPESFDA
jgi:hypothetical protein